MFRQSDHASRVWLVWAITIRQLQDAEVQRRDSRIQQQTEIGRREAQHDDAIFAARCRE